MALTRYQISAHGESRAADSTAVAVILLFFLLAALLVNPLYDTPICDDWGYGKAVKTLLEEGRFHFTWTATSLLFQVLVGTFFCALFGFSFSVLHMVTLLFSVCGILALYGWLRSTGKFFIRYALLLVPGVVILPFDAFRRARLNRTLLCIGLAACFVLGVVFTRDQISFNEARWAAGRWLLDMGIPADHIEGGFEWNCWHLEFGGDQPSPRHEKSRHGNNKIWLIPNNLLTLDTFVNVSSPDGDSPQQRVWRERTYRKINQFGYYSIFQTREREVQVWKAVDKVPHREDGDQIPGPKL